MSATVGEGTIAAGRRTAPAAPAAEGGFARVPVAVVGATGYAGAELIRLLGRHPGVRIVGLVGRERQGDPVGSIHPHLASLDLAVHDQVPADAEIVFLAMPHGAAAARAPELLARGVSIVDLGPDFRLRNPADYPEWYGFEHPRPELLAEAVYGLPELHRDELAALAERRSAGRPVIVGAPGCYSTTTIVALHPLARAGLIADLVVDAKSGVSGAGRDAKPHLHFSEVNESVSAYGIFTHRHTAEIEQELGVTRVTFLPHLIPMTRGILSAGHVRPTRPVEQAELDELYRAAYADEPFVTVVEQPPATKHTLGSNEARVFARADPRTGRVLAIGVLDNLVKGAAGQAIQGFNLVVGFPETTGLLQLPVAP